MAAAFRSKTLNGLGNGTDLTATEPAGAVENDILFYWLIIQSTISNFSAPSGWTLLVDLSNGNTGSSQQFAAWLYWIRRGGSAPSFAVSWTTSRYREASITCWSGCKTTGNPYNVVANNAYNTTTDPAAPNCPAVITTVANTVIVPFGASWQGPTTVYSAPTDYTIREPGEAGTALCVASRDVAAIGSENPGSFGGVPAGAGLGVGEITVALEPQDQPVVVATGFQSSLLLRGVGQ